MLEREIVIELNKIKERLKDNWYGTAGSHTEKSAAIQRVGEAAYWVTEVIKDLCRDDPLNKREW